MGQVAPIPGTYGACVRAISSTRSQRCLPATTSNEVTCYAVRVLGLSRLEAEDLREADIEGLIAGKDGAMWKAVDEAFATRLGPDAHIEAGLIARA